MVLADLLSFNSFILSLSRYRSHFVAALSGDSTALFILMNITYTLIMLLTSITLDDLQTLFGEHIEVMYDVAVSIVGYLLAK